MLNDEIIKTMPTTYRKKTTDTKTLSFEVTYQDEFGLAIVAALFAALGLTKMELVQAFERERQTIILGGIAYKTLTEAFLADIHSDGAWYALALKTAKLQGSAIITYQVPISFYNGIQTFLLSPTAKKILQQLNDAAGQGKTGSTDGIKGAAKNVQEAAGDIGSGLGDGLSGSWDTLTSPVGSDRFSKGIDQTARGVGQMGKGYLKGGADVVRFRLIFRFERCQPISNISSRRVSRETG